jgi:hypothetical protein
LFPDEFIEKIRINTIINEDTCWIYDGTVTNAGYGEITYQGKTYPVHRLVFEHYYGESLPPHYQIHHAVCENKRCIRFDHLSATTASMNNLLKSAFVQKRQARLTKLQYHQTVLTTTELADILEIKSNNVLPYLTAISSVYQDFTFKVVQKGRGPKPNIIQLRSSPDFFQQLAAPAEDWRGKAPFSSASFPIAELSDFLMPRQTSQSC